MPRWPCWSSPCLSRLPALATRPAVRRATTRFGKTEAWVTTLAARCPSASAKCAERRPEETEGSVVDKAKLPSGLRVQMVWAPETTTDPEDRPIALVRDSKRFWISAIPMLIAFLVGSALALLTTQRLLLI